MNAPIKLSSRPQVLAEPLERRTLFSAAWTTVYTDQPAGVVEGMAADPTGNMYVVRQGPNPANPSGPQVATVFQKPAGSTSWSPIYQLSSAGGHDILATDSAGNVFVTDTALVNGISYGIVREKPAGQVGFVTVDAVPGFGARAVGTDGSGDVYVAGLGTVTTTSGKKTTTATGLLVRKLVPNGNGGFVGSTVYQLAGTPYPNVTGITVIDNGASAGVYMSAQGLEWDVYKGSNGGTSWSRVDHYQYAANTVPYPYAVIGDAAGNVYVAGGVANHWLVRESANGGAIWSNVDDYQLQASQGATAWALGTDRAGNIYAVGRAQSATASGGTMGHAIIRTNAGGAWATIDDLSAQNGPQINPTYGGIAADADGTLYAADWGGVAGVGMVMGIRSATGPLPASPFSSSSIAPDSLDPTTSRLVDDLFGA